jgi:hypothetical protein
MGQNQREMGRKRRDGRVGARGAAGSRPVPAGGAVAALRAGIQARVEGGYGGRGAGVGASFRATGGAQGGDRVLCSQCRAHSGLIHV